MHIAICGPCSPSGVSGLLDPEDAARADAFPRFGGVPVCELARGLVRARHQVTVVTTAGIPDVGPTTFKGYKLDVVVVPRRPAGAAIRDAYRRERAAMADALRDARPDIIHAHWTYEFELAAQDSGLRHVTTARDAPWTVLRQMPDAYRLARLGVAWRARLGIRKLIVASPYMVDAWRRQMVYRGEVDVIPNMVPSLPPVEHAKAPSPTAICVADASPLKNVEVLVRAFRSIRMRIPDARLVLVGSGLAATDPLARQLASRGLADGVDFLGHLDRAQLAGKIAAAWCLVHPSLEESFGNTLVEALSLGTPAIGGRDSGAVPWVLDYGRAGDLVDVRSEAELGKALFGRLSADPASPPARALELLDTRYSPEQVVQRHLETYERVIGMGRRSKS